METEVKQERLLAQFSFTRGRKNPKQITVRIFPARSEENRGKPYVARDLNGNEIQLQLNERIWLNAKFWVQLMQKTEEIKTDKI